METAAGGNTLSNSAMPSSAEGVLSNAASNAHKVVNSVAGAVDGVAIKVKPALDRVAAMAHQAVDKAAGAAVPTVDWLIESGGSLNATQKKLVANTCGYVSAHPLKSIGIALAAGFLISRMIR